eukprot:240473-Pyramimonas_sp.AAC.1
MKQLLVEELRNNRKEKAREKDAQRQVKMAQIEAKILEQEQAFDRKREASEEKKLHKEQVLVDVSINRVLARKEQLDKELARAQKAKALAI